MLLKHFQPCDLISFFIAHRVSVGCKHNANCGIVLKLQIHLIQCSVNACFHHFNNIIFHSRQDNLRFRISETCIIFQHFRSVRSQHQSEEDHAFELASLCCHRVNGCLINMLFTKCFHFFCIERTRRKCSHSACIQSGISVARTLVILCGRHRLDRLSVHK